MRRTYDLIVAIVYLILVLAVASPFLFFNRSLYIADVTYNFEPAARFIHNTFVERGGFSVFYPLWNPYVLGGLPFSNLMWPLGYIPGYFASCLPGPQSQGFLFCFHMFVAGFGGYLWQSRKLLERLDPDLKGRQLSACLPGAFFGLVYMLSGYMVGCNINLPLIFTAAWIPLMLYVIDNLRRLPWLASFGLMGLILGQQFSAGRLEIAAASGALYLGYMLFGMFGRKHRGTASGDEGHLVRRPPWLPVVLLLAAAAGAVLYDSVNLIPLAENLTSNPFVAGFEVVSALMWSTGWYEFLNLILSQPLGALTPEKYDLYPTYPGSMPYVTSVFLSAPVMTLAAAGFLDRRWKERIFWIVALVLASCVALGHFLPLAPAIYGAVPALALVRFPVKMMIFVILALAAAAAHGLSRGLEGTASKRMCTVFAALWLVPIGVAAADLSSGAGQSSIDIFLRGTISGYAEIDKAIRQSAVTAASYELIVAGIAGLAASLLLLPTGRHPANAGGSPASHGRQSVTLKFASALLLITMSGALLLNNCVREMQATVDESFFLKPQKMAEWLRKDASVVQGNTRVLSLLEHPLPAPDVVTESGDDPGGRKFMAYARDVLLPNTHIDARIPFINGMPVVPTWASIFLQTGALPRSSQQPEQQHPAGKSDVPLFRFCQSTSTGYVISLDRAIDAATGKWKDVPVLDKRLFHLAHVDGDMNVRIYDVTPIRPRVFITSNVIWSHSRQDALKILNRADINHFNPMRAVVLSGERQKARVNLLDTRYVDDGEANELVKTASVTDPSVKLSANLLGVKAEEIEVSASVQGKSAAVVLTDSFSPGWKAYDNGQPTEVFVADGLSRAIIVGPGEHKIIFHYVPIAYYLGLSLSALALVLFGLAIGFGLKPVKH